MILKIILYYLKILEMAEKIKMSNVIELRINE